MLSKGLSGAVVSRLLPHSKLTCTRLRLRSTVVRTLSTGQKPAAFGQPTHLSHPHLVGHDEITPGITKQEYKMRRKKLMDSCKNDDTIVVCLSGNIKYMSQDIFYKFRQSSDFFYLTGVQEPQSAIVLVKSPSSPEGYTSTLFLRPKDAREELWHGPRTGLAASQTIFGFDEVLDISSFPTFLRSCFTASPEADVYVPSLTADDGARPRKKRSWSNLLSTGFGKEVTFDSVMAELHATRGTKATLPLSKKIRALRDIKSEAEQKLMRRAADVSGTAFAKTMRFTKPEMSEGALAAHFEYLCALNGAERPAYVPVVASGSNSLTIHYTSNDQLMRDGEMVLMDAGCEFHGYASDISRTWPVSGTFTSPQRDLYQAVLNTLKACAALCTESAGVTMYDLHRKSGELLAQELKQIGFSPLLSKSGMDRLYPHFVSHAVGIDLHESGDGRSNRLKDGMVITVEPGIYVPEDPAYPKAFHNMGIRLEDEVLVKKDHPIRLSVNAPLEIADVEGACQGLLDVGPY